MNRSHTEALGLKFTLLTPLIAMMLAMLGASGASAQSPSAAPSQSPSPQSSPSVQSSPSPNSGSGQNGAPSVGQSQQSAPQATDTPSASPAPGTTTTGGSGTPDWVYPVVILGALLIVGLIIYLVAQSRRRDVL